MNAPSTLLVKKHIQPGEKVSKLILEAGAEFSKMTGRDPMFAFVRDIPQGAQEGMEVRGIMLILAEWMEPDQVAVGWGAAHE